MRLAAPLAALLALCAVPASAQDRLSELEKKLDAMSQEIERLKLGEAGEAKAEPSKDKLGLGPAATKVYRTAPNKVSIGGYGEFLYSDPSSGKATADLLRAVLYFGYKFSDKILFNSEIEFEHAGSGEGSELRGEVEVEQAYVDFKIDDAFGVRAGHVLVPLGLVNEIHEPTSFHGANRPSVERFIIPSTWHENGVGVFGRAGPVSWRSYVLAGLTAAPTSEPEAEGFTGSQAIREGRTSGSQSFAEDKAWATRVDFEPVAGVLAGAGLYVGEADQDFIPSAVPVTLWEGHAAAEYRGLELRVLYAEGRVGNADEVNAAHLAADPAFTDFAASRFFGGYAEAAFNALSLVPESRQYLAPFFRYERYDTQYRMPEIFPKDPANSRVEYTLGLTYKPIPQVAVKLDQQWKRNQARTGVNQWNLALGYIF